MEHSAVRWLLRVTAATALLAAVGLLAGPGHADRPDGQHQPTLLQHAATSKVPGANAAKG